MPRGAGDRAESDGEIVGVSGLDGVSQKLGLSRFAGKILGGIDRQGFSGHGPGLFRIRGVSPMPGLRLPSWPARNTLRKPVHRVRFRAGNAWMKGHAAGNTDAHRREIDEQGRTGAMRCETCHGSGTVTLPRLDGKPFGFLALCSSCQGSGMSRSTETTPTPVWARSPRDDALRTAVPAGHAR
jgi:hypothetical protein